MKYNNLNKKAVLIRLVSNHHFLYKSIINYLDGIVNNITFITTPKILEALGPHFENDKIEVYLDASRTDMVLKKQIKRINAHDIILMDEFYGLYLRIWKIKLKAKKKIFILL